MQSWKTTLFEHFAGSRMIRGRYYKVDKFFITYMKRDVWYEMKFEHNLN